MLDKNDFSGTEECHTASHLHVARAQCFRRRTANMQHVNSPPCVYISELIDCGLCNDAVISCSR
jgi:hypothetical protein